MPINISDEELANLIKKGETVSFEYKETPNKDIERLSSYFAAFANTEGGLFVIGINKLKETVGFPLEEKERNLISEQAKNCRPQVHIDIEERDYDGKKIVLIYVPKSDNKIHIDSKYRFPVRVGSNLDYLDITGLIPLAREKLGLDYKTEETDSLPRWGEPLFKEEAKTKIKPEEIELFLKAIKGVSKEVRLQGLRELELLTYKRELFDEIRILDAFKGLLDDKEVEVRKNVLSILQLMLRIDNTDESKQKFIDRYSLRIVDLAKNDLSPQVRSEAIGILVDINNECIIEIFTKIILNESDELYNRTRSHSESGSLSSETKLKFKNKLFEELNNSKHSENVRKRIIEVLEDIRKSPNQYY
ncbi:MAG: ATP-binding protein [Candidatus Methanoperedens sp.]|nr:ATP-binding protein [Candidatus Methanoperedens sp.]